MRRMLCLLAALPLGGCLNATAGPGDTLVSGASPGLGQSGNHMPQSINSFPAGAVTLGRGPNASTDDPAAITVGTQPVH